ncbi:MAG: efflux RND transporter permease subunit [Candidatus Marinimicrobia bacterium]|nr:efflux RND transporter permease subunit [Candidatus Neomarinimicrobiota bacterium]
MIEKFFRIIITNPRGTFLSVIGLTVMWALFLPNLSIDFSIEHLFSQNDPAVERYFSFRDEFGREDNVITIIYEPIDPIDRGLFKELEKLTYDIEDINGVASVVSVFSLSDIDTKAWLGDIYNDDQAWNRDTILTKLKYIQSDPSIGSRVLSKDLRFGAFMLTLSDDANNHQDRSALLKKIKKLALDTSPSWTFSGVSVLRTEYVRYMLRDNFLFLPPIAIILISILGYVFRNWVFVGLPLLTVLITVIWLLGIMGLFGLEINIMTYIVPTLLFIIGISDAIHIQARFRENLARDSSNPCESMLLTMVQMSKVIFLTSLTTSIGFVALMTTSINIVQEFGLEIALGVMIAWLVSILLVPSGIMLFESFEKGKDNTFSPLLNWLSNVIPRHPWAFIIIPLIISFTSIYKIKDLSTDASLMDDLRPQNKLYHDLKMTEKYFGGVLPFEVLLRLDQKNEGKNKTVLDPDIFPFLEDVEDLLKEELMESRFFSMSTLLRSIKRMRGDEDSVSYNSEMINQILGGRSKQQLQLVNSDQNTLRITGLIENKTSSEMESIYTKLDSLSKSFPPYLEIECTGTTVVALRTNDYLVQSLVNSLGIALLFISIVMAFMFRKKSILFASLVTNLIPIFTVLGVLSWLGVSIRPPTAMTFSVALGIAVDDSLHFLLRYRKELKQGMTRVEAIRATIMNTGSALMITTTILVSGFSVLLLSAFLPTYQFGLLSAGMIGTALLCDLTLLPALCLVLPNNNT